MAGILLASAAALVPAGCAWWTGAADGIRGEAASGDRTTGEAGARHKGAQTAPLTADVVASVLRRHGFSVQPDPGSELLSAEDIVVDLTNIRFDGPHENIDAHEEIAAREGHVGCAIRRGPIWSPRLQQDLDAAADSPVFSGKKAEFFLANVECTIYPEGEGAEAQVRRLQAAMDELERRVGERNG